MLHYVIVTLIGSQYACFLVRLADLTLFAGIGWCLCFRDVGVGRTVSVCSSVILRLHACSPAWDDQNLFKLEYLSPQMRSMLYLICQSTDALFFCPYPTTRCLHYALQVLRHVLFPCTEVSLASFTFAEMLKMELPPDLMLAYGFDDISKAVFFF